MRNAIQARGLACRLSRTFKLHDVDLNVPSGSIYGFLGPNGSGKTTTIRLLLGMMRPDSGTVHLLDHPVPSELPRALVRTGFVPERPHIYPALTVEETLRYHSAFYPTWDDEWAGSLRRRFELSLDMRVRRMSKGEVGKLMILLALGQRPELLVLDEPTDGLDPLIRRDVLTAVLDYVSERSATVFISSHLIHELERICDWVGIVDGGRLVAELPMHSFKNGLKRLRLDGAPPQAADAPFTLLTRETDGLARGETWVVRGWRDPMRQYFEGAGTTVREVIDLDLEEAFVELLRSSREVEK